MKNVRIEISSEISKWLVKVRLQNRMSIAEAAKKAALDESMIVGWEAGFPIPLSDFLVLMQVYGVGSAQTGARISAWQSKFLESPGRGRA